MAAEMPEAAVLAGDVDAKWLKLCCFGGRGPVRRGSRGDKLNSTATMRAQPISSSATRRARSS